MRCYRTVLALVAALLGSGFPDTAAQSIDHWETVVMDDEVWRYLVPASEPDPAWTSRSFDDSGWSTGPGGFGYGDDDDGTVIGPTLSVYQRIRFTVADTSVIGVAVLHVDFDDGFVAYLNGTEVARANIGTPGTPPRFNQRAAGLHEADLFRGITPASIVLRMPLLSPILRPGENVLAVQTHNESLASSDLSSRAFLTLGVVGASMDYRSPPSWFEPPTVSDGTFATNLPLIIIDTEGQVIPDEPKVRARMGIVDNGPGNLNLSSDAFNDYDGFVGIELRGRSSLSFPKNSFAVETRDADGNDLDVSLLGFPPEEDWVLYAPYSDKSLMRNALIFRLSNRIGRYATRTRFVELVVNDDYRGVYVLMERIKRDTARVDVSTLNPAEVTGDDLTGGYIIKIDESGPGWVSPYAPREGLDRRVSYQYHYPGSDDIAPQQQQYIAGTVTAFEDAMASSIWADPHRGYSAFIDVDAAVDYFILHELARNVDSYRLSTYLHKDKDSVGGGKLVFGPLWDFNFSFGNVDYYDSGNHAGFQVESGVPDADGSHPPFWWKKLWKDPAFNRRVIERWDALRSGPFRTDSLLQLVDDMAELLAEPADRNFDRWPVLGTYIWPNAFIGSTYEEEVDFLKAWIADRVAWIDANLGRVVASESPEQPVGEYSLSNVHPMPFSGAARTTLNVERAQHVQAEVFDSFGRRLLVIHDGYVQDGASLNLVIDAAALASGVYVLRVSGQTFKATRTAVVAK